MALRALLARGVALCCLLDPTNAALLRHASTQKDVKRNVDYEVTLANFNNVQYSGIFSLGGQSLPVVYDTGSFEILVLSTLCTSCSPTLAKYDSSRSGTFVSAGGLEAQHVFGSGPVNSRKGFESVWIGDANSPYHVVNMPFWEVTDHDIAVWNEHAHFSGIVGLCHPAVVPAAFSTTEANQPGDSTLLAATQVDAFSFCFQRSSQNASGFFHMGPSIAALPQSGNFMSMPVVGQVHWGVMMTSISVPGIQVANPCVPSCGAIIDSGTSLIAAPPSASELINALKSMVAADCSNIDSLPVLQLTLGGVSIELPPRAYVIKASLLGLRIPLDPVGVWDFIWNGPTTTVVDQCTVAFMTIEKSSQFGPVWILGMPFMRYYYTVFQRSSKQIHVARASPSCQVPYGGPHVFTNISAVKGVGSHVALRGTSSVGYGKSDFMPTWVDLKAARLPKW
eukprot:CAMPEP_0169105490 /NCGR_PEP_ID=MMETSP1015-20121227/23824_1 /TAXON_ID=342587 /ORGANISM="Karlodinium micrum, Strain CCMP2283" /LENGTH=450 /DNA_ID=CAMNT_0009166853 /DNA_START=70 /DNA_END=1419 /DNA_ORIENTATION=+